MNTPMAASQNDDMSALLGRFNFDTLLAGAANLRPEHKALTDLRNGRVEQISFGDFDRRATRLAHSFRGLGLRNGDRILLVGSATSTTIIALIAGLRAGFDVVLAGRHLNAGELGTVARQTGIAALVGEACAGDESCVDNLFSVAALASDVRLVCALGNVEIDGAVTIDPHSPTRDTIPELAPAFGRPSIFTIAANGLAIEHAQQTLVAAALDFAARSRIGAEAPILTTFAPVSFAGLVAGPLASLLSGATLMLHEPFSSKDFLATIEAQPVHLVAPASLVDSFGEAGLLERSRVSIMISVLRCDTIAGAELRTPNIAPHARRSRLVDLYAFSETAAVAEPRGADLVAFAPAYEQHMISMDTLIAIAIRRSPAGDFLEGSAVTSFASP